MERQGEERWQIPSEAGIAGASGIDFTTLFELMPFGTDRNSVPQRGRIEILK